MFLHMAERLANVSMGEWEHKKCLWKYFNLQKLSIMYKKHGMGPLPLIHQSILYILN